MRRFLSRPDFARRYGLMCTSQLRTWKEKGWPLPPNTKVAVMIDGTVYEAKAGENLHCQINTREAGYGREVVDGFAFDDPTLQIGVEA